MALIAVKTFIGYLQKHGLKMFGIYRIIAAIVIFVLMQQNIIKKEEKEPAKTAVTRVIAVKGRG